MSEPEAAKIRRVHNHWHQVARSVAARMGIEFTPRMVELLGIAAREKVRTGTVIDYEHAAAIARKEEMAVVQKVLDTDGTA